MSRKITAVFTAAALMLLSGCGGKTPEMTADVRTLPAGTSASSSQQTEAVSSVKTTGTSALEKYVITCDEIAGKALSDKSVEHPRTMLVTDDKMMSDVIGYDVCLTTDYSVNIQLVSADLFELTVMRVPEENGKAVLDMLNARRDYLIEMAAAYPKQIAAAEATIVEHVGDIYYLICSVGSKELEKLVISAVKHN